MHWLQASIKSDTAALGNLKCWRAAWLGMVLCGLLSGCANTKNASTQLDAEIDKLTEQDKAPVPQEVQNAVLDNRLDARSGPRRFDVAVNNMAARTFFNALAADASVNIVTDPDVTGAVSLQLRQVTLDEVLDVTRDMFGYEYHKQGGIYTVYARQMRTQVFQINNIDVTRRGQTDTQVNIGSTASNSSSNASTPSSGGESAAKETTSSENNSGARVQTKHESHFWADLQNSLEAIVGSEDGRSVIVNPAAGLVVVKALPKDVNAVRNFLEKSELSIKRQVILETKILEVRLNNGFEAGVNWNAISGQLVYGYNVQPGFGINGDGATVDRWRNWGDVNRSYTDAQGVDTTIGSTYAEKTGGVFASMLQVNDISKLLSLLKTQGDVQVLSSPRVSTVNNQKAVIRVGSDEYFVTGITNNTTSSAAATTNSPNIELASFFSGISLDVTPQIADNGDVILHVHPMVSDVQDQQKNLTVGDQKFSLPLALREVRESDSVVRARSGQVVVLGGLMQETSKKLNGKRPLLGDIPVLNTLFKTKSSSGNKTELVILMRPVVVSENTWQDQLKEESERFKVLTEELRKR
ncbi:MAG TPA: pilus (MSHA type) biogenesis protein MshL [Marinagarivorans sp.]|nr:pilus (MSHA type) biogenesis protein MshL [Marinagarivorans sp.]HNG58997.1 pilus (MSHA type) biogenesis protein MshL [Cellvibrionaceae bacterium]